GDGQVTGWPASAPGIKAGDKLPIVFVTNEHQDVAPDVPLAIEVLKDEAKKNQIRAITSILNLSRGFFGPPEMDPAAVEEMRAAIEATLTDPAVVEEMEGRGMPIVFAPGAEQQTSVEEIFAASGDLTPVFKEALAQIQ